MKKAFFNWSGGKDSALALHKAQMSSQFQIEFLLTTLNKESDRISMHGVRAELLHQQAESLGIPLRTLQIPSSANMEAYDSIMSNAMEDAKAEGVTTAIYGDIFLEDLKNYREKKLAEVGLEAAFPIWKNPTRELIFKFIDLGFKTIVVAANGQKLDKSFVGEVIDRTFVEELPDDVDVCGENGEFHTFVFDGPNFKFPIAFELG